MSENNKPERDWVNIAIKVFTPVVAGLLIAWAGFVSNYTLSSISSQKESARLIAELQISREQAESELRKDVFDHTLQAFLLKNPEQNNTVKGMSKQLLRLELLALNFGDSLSMSPLFSEFRRDLLYMVPVEGAGEITFDEDKGDLAKRLNALAKRVASTQVSSLIQHGTSKKITIPLKSYITGKGSSCEPILSEDFFPWPERDTQREFAIYDDNNTVVMSETEIKNLFQEDADVTEKEHSIKTSLLYMYSLNEKRRMSLDDVVRYLELIIEDVNLCEESLKITVKIYKESNADYTQQLHDFPQITERGDLSIIATEGLQIDVEASFTLDYFNFPLVDNTRLENNHRFAIVLEKFDLKSEQPFIQLVGVVFPSEYASLRDRPGMKEARDLLKSALEDDSENAGWFDF